MQSLERHTKAGKGQRQGAWHNYDVQDGLLSPRVTHILQDREGALWLATLGGLSSYDGQTFTSYNGLIHDQVHSLCQSPDGRIWVGTEGGLNCYDGQTLTCFTIQDGLANNWVHSICLDQEGLLWLATYGGLSCYDGQTFTCFTSQDGLAHNWVYSVCSDQEGLLWVGTEGGLSCYDGQTFTCFTSQDGLAHNKVYSIFSDQKGLLWVGTEGGLSCYDGQTFTCFTSQDGLAHNRVYSICSDQEGLLWVGTEGGLSCYDGRAFTCFTTQDGLTNNRVYSVCPNPEGLLWLGTGGGLSLYYTHFSILTTKDGLADNGVMSLFESGQGDLWVGTWKGVSRFDGARFHLLEGTEDKNTWSIVEDRRGRLWFGTRVGLSCYDGAQIVTFTSEDGLLSNSLTCVLVDRQGRLWIGSQEGINCFAEDQFTSYTTRDGLACDNVRSILEDRNGAMWFGTANGLSRYDGQSFTSFTTQDGLAGCDVIAIFQDRDGIMWFGTANGLSRYDGRTFTRFTTEDGLPYDVILSIMQDRDGILWLSTFGGGLGRYDGLIFQRLTRADGLPHNAVQQILQDRRGVVWIATEDGLTRYRPSMGAPTIAIQTLIADRAYDLDQDIALSDSLKLVVIQFQGRSFTTHADDMVYTYRLEGFHADWQRTKENRVEIQNLPVGTYTFKVRAADQELNYSQVATLQFEIVPDPLLQSLTQTLSNGGIGATFIGDSVALEQVQRQLSEVATTDVTVLILGETGTGKGLAAAALHGMSNRRDGPFIQINCGALPEGLVESELFGHEKGAFTGAMSRKVGKVELAQGGTLFLDEIGDMPLSIQVKLLHFLQDQRFERVGGTQGLTADVRLMAATNRDLPQMVKDGTFREDLYFRLQVFPIHLPPLRHRRDDIPLLAVYFVEQMAAHLDKAVRLLSPEALQRLQGYGWPGNVRELEHALQRAVIVCRGTTIQAEDLALGTTGPPQGAAAETIVPLSVYEREYIERVLKQTGSIRKTATLLGLPQSTLRSRMAKLGVKRP